MKASKKVAAHVAGLLMTGVVATAAVAAVLTLTDVNQKVAAILAPMNNADTSYSAEFTDLSFDAVRTLGVGFKGNIKKKSALNELDFSINNLDYQYGDGKTPTIKVDLELRLDLVKAFGQKMLNEVGQALPMMVKEMAAEQTKQYGAAISIDAATDTLLQDTIGNVEFVQIHFDSTVDMAQLPTTMPKEEVDFLGLKSTFAAAKNGMTLKIELVLNPENKAFASGNDGLKEALEKLLADDQATYQELGQFLGMIDRGAQWLVDSKP